MSKHEGEFMSLGEGEFLSICEEEFLSICEGEFLYILEGEFLSKGEGEFLEHLASSRRAFALKNPEFGVFNSWSSERYAQNSDTLFPKLCCGPSSK